MGQFVCQGKALLILGILDIKENGAFPSFSDQAAVQASVLPTKREAHMDVHYPVAHMSYPQPRNRVQFQWLRQDNCSLEITRIARHATDQRPELLGRIFDERH